MWNLDLVSANLQDQKKNKLSLLFLHLPWQGAGKKKWKKVWHFGKRWKYQTDMLLFLLLLFSGFV